MSKSRVPASICAAVLMLGLLSPVASAGPVQFSVHPTGAAKVHQGRPLPFEATLNNGSSESVTIDYVFELRPSDGSAPVAMVRWSETVGPGDSASFPYAAVSSQWFPQRGDFSIDVRSGDGNLVDSLDYEVGKPEVRIPRFEDVAPDLGVADTVADFACGSWVGGSAWGDVDGDGNLDLFLPRRDAAARLWMNDGVGGFSDQAAERGLGDLGNNVATGASYIDYDNDGDEDLFVTFDGPNHLYRNDDSDHFTDVSAEAGIVGDGPTQSASWGDYDNDGFNDLYVANHVRCGASGKTYFEDQLFHNEGDGTFTDATSLLGPAGSTSGAGFQALWFDYDRDTDLDLYLANDFYGPQPKPNYLWRNDGPGEGGATVFTNVSIAAGMAITMNTMGIAAGDYDRDQDLDIGLSNIREQRLMRNTSEGGFVDRGSESRIARPYHDATNKAITWGITFSDLNNDGWEDLYSPSGKLGKESFQPNEVFANARDGSFLDVSAPSGADDLGVGRGVALNDFDGDGAVDIYLVNMDGTSRLFRNVTPHMGHWLELELVGTVSNRDSCGATATLISASGKQFRQVFCGGTSVASGSDKALHFGLGSDTEVKKVVIRWPSGRVKKLTNPKIDRRRRIVEPSVQANKSVKRAGAAAVSAGPPAGWRTWLLESPDQFRLQAPPGDGSNKTRRELKTIRNMQAAIGPKIQRRIKKWNSGAATVPWTETYLKMIKKHRPFVAPSARGLALFHLALYDALVAADDSRKAFDRSAPFELDVRIEKLTKSRGSSYPATRAVLAGAAEKLLTTLFPNEPPQTFEALADAATDSMVYAGVNYPSDVRRGRTLGREVADLFIAYGGTDGHTNTGFSEPRPDGEQYWETTPPGFEPPTGGPVGTWKPWLMASPDQGVAQIPPPLEYGSPEFMDSLQEVFDIQENLTPQQAQIAAFWDDGPGTLTPPGHWTQIALDQVDSHHLGTNATVQTMALLDAALYDSVIAFFRVKYHYWSIRPVSAMLRLCDGSWTLCTKADLEADPARANYPDWLSYINTPNFPAYPSGHATFSGAAGKILGFFFPDSTDQLNAMAEEAAMSRLYGGIHFRSDNDFGLVLGRYVGGLAEQWLTSE